MLKKESVLGPALLLMCGRTLAFAATFFIPVILARIFDPTQFGTYKQLFLIFTSVNLIAQAGMATSLYYFLPRGATACRKIRSQFPAVSRRYRCAMPGRFELCWPPRWRDG